MEEEISLEDLARGVVPKKDRKGKKTQPVSSKVKTNVKKMADMALGHEALSIKSLKKFNETELKMLAHAADELQESLYRVKSMIRESIPKEKMGGMITHC